MAMLRVKHLTMDLMTVKETNSDWLIKKGIDFLMVIKKETLNEMEIKTNLD
jgi:hypothetical protein